MDCHLNQSVLTQLTNLPNIDQSSPLGIDFFSKSKFLKLKIKKILKLNCLVSTNLSGQSTLKIIFTDF